MANIFDYLTWRGDLTLAQSEFNEIDNLILARFSYFPFDHILNKDEIITMKEAQKRWLSPCSLQPAPLSWHPAAFWRWAVPSFHLPDHPLRKTADYI